MQPVCVAPGRWTLFVDPAWPGFAGHFPGRPILPAAEIISLATEMIGAGPLVLVAARLVAPVKPGDYLAFTQPPSDHVQILVHRENTLVADLRWRDARAMQPR